MQSLLTSFLLSGWALGGKQMAFCQLFPSQSSVQGATNVKAPFHGADCAEPTASVGPAPDLSLSESKVLMKEYRTVPL